MHSISFRSTSPRRLRLAHLILAGSLITLGACDEDTPTDPVRVGSVEVTPRLTTNRVGTTQQLTAVAKDASGNAMSGETITWQVAEPTVATVSATGLVTFVGSGSTAILARARGTAGFATVVSEANVSGVAVQLPSGASAATASLQFPLSLQLYAKPLDAQGGELFRPVTWTTSAPTIATVSSTGLVTSVATGTVTITATSEGKTGTAVLTIVPPAPVASISFTPNSGFLPTTVGVPLVATLRDAANVILTGRVITWSTSDPAVATVSGTGVVTAVTPGTVTITATSEGQSSAATFTTLTGLRSGTAVTVANPNEKTPLYFAVYVPAGSTNLGVTLRNGNGDPDLYTYRPGTNTPLCSSENGGATIVEDCVAANPLAGVWVIEVFAWLPHAGTTLTATVTPTPP